MKHKFYEVSKPMLLLIAGIVWMIAGFNVARIGISAYNMIEFRLFLVVLSALIFVLFGNMFFRMVRKHRIRIVSYEEEKKPFWYFFNLKSYIIMACMMTMGIGLRVAGVFPDIFVAFFYTGLGAALFLAGVLFVIYFVKERK